MQECAEHLFELIRGESEKKHQNFTTAEIETIASEEAWAAITEVVNAVSCTVVSTRAVDMSPFFDKS